MSRASAWFEKQQAPGALWLEACHTDKSGNPIPTFHNACLGLEGDPDFRGRLGFDEMRRCPCWDTRPLDDAEVMVIHRSLQKKGLRRLSLEVAHEAVRHIANQSPFHPLKEWLEGLKWDGEERVERWLSTFLGATDDDYHRNVGTMFLVAMVARIFQPGCQADYMLVLEGGQGELKSQACRALAGSEYFSDALPSLGSDDVRTAAHLRGKWLVEISELSAFSKADAALLKSFITRQVEKFIPKFGRMETIEPRQCCFIGTTNDDTYLKDETGGRRFWPVRCGAIKLGELRRARDQLFAEAISLWQDGRHWWPDRAFEKEHIEPVQGARLWVDAWDDPIREYLTSLTLKETSISQVASIALSFDKPRLGLPEQKRIAALLRQQGWELHRSNSERLWKPKA